MLNIRRKKINFFENSGEYTALLRKNHVILFLDFDGTLAAIVDHYKSATILKESKVLLSKITKMRGCSIAIVSGRELADVKKRVGLKNIIYAGNHGLEVVGPGIALNTFVKVDIRKIFRAIKAELSKDVGRVKGVHLEDKNLTLSIHYRLVQNKNVDAFKKRLFSHLLPYVVDRKVVVSEGKKVFDIKPRVEWDKGSVVLWLLKRLKKSIKQNHILPIFIGDDVTDEAAFKALKKKGLCIRVGENRSSAAPYFLKDIKQVARFLKTILDSRVKS